MTSISGGLFFYGPAVGSSVGWGSSVDSGGVGVDSAGGGSGVALKFAQASA